MLYSKVILFIFFTLLLSVFSFSQPLINAKIEKKVQEYVKSKKNHSLVIGIINGAQTEIKGFGKMSKQYPFSPDKNTLFEVGQVTFPFTTTLMMMESQKGKFNIENRVQKYIADSIYIPSYRPVVCIETTVPPSLPGDRPQRYVACSPNLSAPQRQISFCDLAAHTSGLRNSPDNYFNWTPFNQFRGNDKDFTDISKSAFYKLLADCDVQNEPGNFYHYSNAGIALLGNVLGEINDTSYAYLVQENILQPLELNSSFFAISAKQKHRLAPPHNSKGNATKNWEFAAMLPAGGLVSSGNDLVSFLQANLVRSPNRVSDAFEQVQESRIDLSERKFGRPTWVGYGWFISTLNKATNQPVVWQNGATGGYRSFVGFVKDTQIGIVILSNSGNGVEEMGFEILEMLHQ